MLGTFLDFLYSFFIIQVKPEKFSLNIYVGWCINNNFCVVVLSFPEGLIHEMLLFCLSNNFMALWTKQWNISWLKSLTLRTVDVSTLLIMNFPIHNNNNPLFDECEKGKRCITQRTKLKHTTHNFIVIAALLYTAHRIYGSIDLFRDRRCGINKQVVIDLENELFFNFLVSF